MDDPTYPYLYEVNSEQKHPLSEIRPVTIGAEDSCDIPLDHCQAGEAFRVQRNGGDWQIVPGENASTVSLNQVAIDGPCPLRHLSIVQADHSIFVFVEHEDQLTATAYSANIWLITKLLDQPGLSGIDPNQTIDIAATVRMPRRDELKAHVPLEVPGSIELLGGN